MLQYWPASGLPKATYVYVIKHITVVVIHRMLEMMHAVDVARLICRAGRVQENRCCNWYDVGFPTSVWAGCTPHVSVRP